MIPILSILYAASLYFNAYGSSVLMNGMQSVEEDIVNRLNIFIQRVT